MPVVSHNRRLRQHITDRGAELRAHVDRHQLHPRPPRLGALPQPPAHRSAAAAIHNVEHGTGVQVGEHDRPRVDLHRRTVSEFHEPHRPEPVLIHAQTPHRHGVRVMDRAHRGGHQAHHGAP